MPASRDPATHAKVCGHPGPRERLLAEAGFDEFEIRALELMRLAFAAMGRRQPRYAPRIADVAHTLFGCHRGSVILAGLTAFVQAMALSRSDPFRYSSPFCAGCAGVLTENEHHLLSILHHARRGSTGRAMTHALFLCDARPVGPLLDAAADLASLVPPRGCGPVAPSP